MDQVNLEKNLTGDNYALQALKDHIFYRRNFWLSINEMSFKERKG